MTARVLEMRSEWLDPARYRISYRLADGTRHGLEGEIVQPDSNAALRMFRIAMATHRPTFTSEGEPA